MHYRLWLHQHLDPEPSIYFFPFGVAAFKKREVYLLARQTFFWLLALCSFFTFVFSIGFNMAPQKRR